MVDLHDIATDDIGAPPLIRRRVRIGPAEDSVDSLVDDMVVDVDNLVAFLMDAVRRAVPQRYQAQMDDAEWPDIAAVFIPAVLECVRRGEPLQEPELEMLRASSRERAAKGLPLIIALLVCRAGIGAFGRYVMSLAGTHRLPAAVVVLSRLAMLSHDTSTAAGAGYPSAPPSPPPTMPLPKLPDVPHRILQLAALGRPTHEIARELHYSDQAVTYHLGQLMKRFEVPNRTALIARAVQRGVVTLPEPWDAPPG